MARDVFISYSSQDKDVAHAVCAWIEAQGIECWIAPRDILPSNTWGESIINAIKQAKLMLVIFSSHANKSPQIKREVERAVHLGLPILPMRIENVAPTGDLDYFLAIPQWFNAFASPIESHLESLVTIVQKLISAPSAGETGEAVAHIAHSDRAPVTHAAPAVGASTPLVNWSPELLHRLEAQLAMTVGPIAKVLVRNAARGASNWATLTTTLANQIENRAEKEAFLSFCSRIKR